MPKINFSYIFNDDINRVFVIFTEFITPIYLNSKYINNFPSIFELFRKNILIMII